MLNKNLKYVKSTVENYSNKYWYPYYLQLENCKDHKDHCMSGLKRKNSSYIVVLTWHVTQ